MADSLFKAFLLPLFCSFFLFTGCNSSQKRQDYLPLSTGVPGEVIVVMDSSYWDASLGKAIQKTFSRPYPMLPQNEPIYTVSHYEPQTLTSLIEKHRNIIMAEVGKGKEAAASINLLKDVWAKDQLVIKLEGHDKDSLKKAFLAKKEIILDHLVELERKRGMKDLKKLQDRKLIRKLESDHGISLLIPKDYEVNTNKGNFVWMENHYQKTVGNRSHDVVQGLFIYYYPYEKESSFSDKNLLRVRDSLLNKYVPGPSEGSYMTTEDRFKGVEPMVEKITHQGQYAVKLRGLWRVENDYMGGPFISLTTYDKPRNRIVTVEGYVFAPKFDKREYLREVENVLHSLKFSAPSSSS